MSVSVFAMCKSYGEVKALDFVDLLVNKGEFFTLLGPSGCGKTTLLRIIAGLETPDNGLVMVSGKHVTDKPANARPVNTVFQSYALFPHLSVFENVAFGLRARKVAGGEVERRTRDALAMVQLEALGGRRPEQLSGGQQQRVALARALVNEPEVLLLDEPMSALDAKLRVQVQIELRQLQRRLGKTFIMVTHDQDEAMTVSDRMAVMNKAKVIQCGTPRDVYERPGSRFVAEFLGQTNLLAGERTAAGVKTDLGLLRVTQPMTWDKHGWLAIRPEQARLAAEAPAANGIRAKIRDAVYRGSHLEIWVEPGPLRLHVPPAARCAPGDEVWIELPADALVPLAD